MNPTISRRIVVSLLSLVGLGVHFLGSAQADDKPREKVFVGYLFGPAREIHYPLYTHICQAFVTADAEGKLLPSRNVPNREVVTDAHKAGVKVLISLGGWGWDKQFASMVTKPEAEERYVTSVMKLIEDYDYDGIDLDWEYPDTKDEVVGFERLSRRFRKDMDAVGLKKGKAMVLTMAASSNNGTLHWLEKDFLLETMDWINVMTYDYTGDWTDYAGHQSPLFASTRQPGGRPRSTEATMRYLLDERKMPADRLAVGIPLYGRGFNVAEPYASTRNAPKTRLPQGNFNSVFKLINDKGWTRQWDDQTKTPWAVSPDRSQVIGYDDAESVAIKTEWAMKQGFRGVFFWEIAADRLPDGTNPLQEASRKKWVEGGGSSRP